MTDKRTPPGLGKPLNSQPDLDFSVISRNLFCKCVNAFRLWTKDFSEGIVSPMNAKEKFFWESNLESVPKNINRGFIDPYKIPLRDRYHIAQKVEQTVYMLKEEIVGLDIVSRESAYKMLHAKLVKSYAMEAILQKKENAAKSKNDKAKAFIKETSSCSEKKYESVGSGWDYRYEGKKVVGSALLYRKKVIHMAFFRVTEGEKVGPMAGYSRRRDFRTD